MRVFNLLLIFLFIACNGNNDLSWMEGSWVDKEREVMEIWEETDNGLKAEVYGIPENEKFPLQTIHLTHKRDQYLLKNFLSGTIGTVPSYTFISTDHESEKIVFENTEAGNPFKVIYEKRGDTLVNTLYHDIETVVFKYLPADE